ncbi:MAG: TrmH family RNA methyltransferase [Parcubacteria group bacterium]|nr:TrmH family RNA methyltransferase [Parcubacteria group bacterium]
MRDRHTVVLLHNIRSAHNVGSIFRTSDAAGVERIILSGYTPRPVDRFGRGQKDIAKTALGAEKSVPWEYVKTPQEIINKLHANGWSIIGVEQDARAKNYREPLPLKRVFVLGNEVRGLSHTMRAQCDMLIEIPMRGKKESLNVSVAAGIILFGCR